MFDLHYCRQIVLGYPVTVEKYGSGQVGFVARPMIRGRRHNRSFATSKYGTAENTAKAAIAFCKEVYTGQHAERLVHRQSSIPENLLPEISDYVAKLLRCKVDPVKVLREAAAAAVRKELEQK